MAARAADMDSEFLKGSLMGFLHTCMGRSGASWDLHPLLASSWNSVVKIPCLISQDFLLSGLVLHLVKHLIFCL